MDSSPVLTIVTAVRDGLELFRSTANSIVEQSFRSWQWVIVDDGSREPVEEFLLSLRDPRIKCIRKEASQGQTKSLNESLRLATTDWVVRMDGDDIALPNRLEAIAQAISGPGRDASLIFSAYEVISESGRKIGEIEYNPLSRSFYSYLMKKNNPIAHPTVAIKRHAPDGTIWQYDESLANAQDYKLWREMYTRRGEEAFHIINEPLLRYRLARQSLSGARAPEQAKELKQIRFGKNSRFSAIHLKPLTKSQSEAMYASRVLFYRFISRTTPLDSRTAGEYFRAALTAPWIGRKALFWYFLFPVRSIVKQLFFGRIFR